MSDETQPKRTRRRQLMVPSVSIVVRTALATRASVVPGQLVGALFGSYAVFAKAFAARVSG